VDLAPTAVELTTEVEPTERLVLRPFRPDDVDAVFRASQDPKTQRWISAIPVPETSPGSTSRRSRRASGPKAPACRW
jgi:RimJ/RimL family protein N-acetyltransferase